MRLFKWVGGAFSSAALVFVGVSFFMGAQSLSELLNNNKEFRLAIERLSAEQQIGYAKVISQENDDAGQLWTTLKFIETSREKTEEVISEQQYKIAGDVIHFDLLIVRFPKEMVADGKERSLYLWRRIYGENQQPSQAFSINQEGDIPNRYKDLFTKLKLSEQQTLWDGIWSLSNDPQALSEYGIQAIYGNAVYKQLRPGLVYIFKIDPSGNVFPETIPDF